MIVWSQRLVGALLAVTFGAGLGNCSTPTRAGDVQPPPASTMRRQSSAPEQHALVLSKSDAAAGFVADAARFAERMNLIPITLAEIDAFLEAERIKDLAGCDEVTCYSELGGALGMRFLIRVVPNEQGTRALLTLHDLQDMGKIGAREMVSRESAVDALKAEFRSHAERRREVLAVLKEVPCRFSWIRLLSVLGPPHGRTDSSPSYHPGGYGHFKDPAGYIHYHYFDFEIVVSDERVIFIKKKDGYLIGPDECR